MWGDSSYLKSENSKGSGLYELHIRNQVILNDENLCVCGVMLIKSVRCRLLQIYILYLELIKTFIGKEEKRKRKKKTYSDTMFGNTSLWVTQEQYVSHYHILIQ